MIDSEVLARAVAAVQQACGDEVIAEMFRRSMAENLPAVAERLPDGTTFVLTGDIPAMWLRDSAAQLRPYLLVCRDDPGLQDVLIGVLHRQLEYVVLDPYANAFNKSANGAGHVTDETEMAPWVWERKYEIDSLCFPLDLAYRLWRITGRADVIDHRFRAAAEAIVDLWTVEQDHEARSPYRFQRHDERDSDTLVREGRGRLTRPTGMSWSAFRPSDDATELGFNVPGNMFASVVLGYLQEIATEVLRDEPLADRAKTLKAEIDEGITQYGTIDHPVHGRVYAYEVDGLGESLLMDDANMPSLLSIPLTGYAAADDPTYLATRSLLLSPDNPYYYSGTAAAGIGSPHTPPRYIWHIALAVQGISSTSADERQRLLELLRDTTGGTGQMHEGFDVDDPHKFTREWFSWANAMFCELALVHAGIR
ncbi:meiotically up-regulated gene 157 (Mug157) protein [Kribbella aluminosa]|uniref:Meiotically up-regulated gene 157 (Mug157) protein n=1 Tax=Kribbella aluminosa TaxID=416017 RepID=A0ABS4UKW8_9ACTN|nr:glycoside hydrolase family 125 protein [Kribbella aluminosa]MBP2352277.1 meiotically up-regulated gene 157 (Mug157) protein [Kribbella aluminosa]